MAKKKKSGSTSAVAAPPADGVVPGVRRHRPVKSDYSNRAVGRSTFTGVNATFRPGFTVLQISPKWQGKGAGVLYFRPLPHMDYDQPDSKLQRSRNSLQPYDTTAWIRRVPVASWVGTTEGEKLTFITHDPSWETRCGYNAETDNPYHIAYKLLTRAKTHGESTAGDFNTKWSKLIGKDVKMAPWPRFTDHYYLQALVYQNGKELYVNKDRKVPLGLGPKDPLPIITVTKAVGTAIQDMFEIPNPAGQVEGKFEKSFKHGDPVGPKFGRILGIFNPSLKTFKKIPTASSEGIGGDGDYETYDLAVCKQYKAPNGTIFEPAISDEQLKLIWPKLVFWEELLNCGPADPEGKLAIEDVIAQHHHQVCVWMAKAFRTVPDMLRYGWDGHEEFLTDDVKAILSARKSVGGGKVQDEAADDEDEDEDDDEDEDEDDTDTSAESEEGDDDEDDDEDEAPTAPASEASEDEEEDEEDDEDEDDDEDEEDDEAEDPLAKLTRAELKALNVEKKLGIRVKKSLLDDDLRVAVGAALKAASADDDEDDDEEEDDEDEEPEDTPKAGKKSGGKKSGENSNLRDPASDPTFDEEEGVDEKARQAAVEKQLRDAARLASADAKKPKKPAEKPAKKKKKAKT